MGDQGSPSGLAGFEPLSLATNTYRFKVRGVDAVGGVPLSAASNPVGS
jgi:hypothetical protein